MAERHAQSRSSVYWRGYQNYAIWLAPWNALIRKIERGLWEVRSNISVGIARVFFTVIDKTMILLHGFVKKSQKTPQSELDTARRRLNNLEKE